MYNKLLKLGLMSVLGLALMLASTVLAADGDLDTNFDTDGVVTTDFGGSTDYGYAVALQADGKIVVAGTSNNDFAVARYNSDGSLDTSFDSDGMLTADFTGGEDIAAAVAIQSDGKIVVGGRSHSGSNYDFAVVRYNHDGTLDTTFSDDGMVTTDFSNGDDYGHAIAIQSDGKIMVAGQARIGSYDDFALVRYHHDGSLDTSFETDGKVSTDINGNADNVRAIALQADGKIVVAGQALVGSDYDVALVRYNSDGSLDTSLDTDGKVNTDFNSRNSYGRAVALQADGKIVVAGQAYVGNYQDFALVRYNNDGSLDTSFNTDGKVTTSITNYHDYGHAMAIQPDGKIVVVGYNHSANFALVRYLSDGSTDNTFSDDGILTTNLGTNRAFAAAIQPDGQIVAAGYSNYDFAVVRYQNDASTLQAVIDAASDGDKLTLDNHLTYAGGLVLNKPLTIDLNGATIGAGSPAFTVTAPDVTVMNGTLDGEGDASPAVLVQSGGDNFTLKETEVTNWADGVQVAADVTSFKLVGNYIHDNADAGLQVSTDVDFAGLVTIEGNLFKNNTGEGIQNNGNTNLPAQYNSWGDINGAAAGDGVSANVDASNPTFAELFVAVNPGSEDQSREVEELSTFQIDLNVDAAGLYGVQYELTYDSSLITLDGVSDGTFRGTGACTNDTSTAGAVSVFCYRRNPDLDGSGTPLQISDLTFTANGSGLTGVGPWINHFDLSHLTLDLASGARNGIKVYVNNSGFGTPSQVGLREITDINDGEIVITAPAAQYTGFINLEGRTDDSGVLMQVYDQEARTGSTLLASATNVADGSYTTVFEGLHKLYLNNSYHFQADAPLHLPTTASDAISYTHSVELTSQPMALNTLVLLGGDATNDNTITLADATCLGSDFGTTTSTCTGTDGNSDVNLDGQIDLIDLVLMSGNYTKTSSPWTP